MNASPTRDVTAGKGHHREAYQGTDETFRKMARKIREAARDPKTLPAFQQFAEAIVRKAGYHPNDRSLTHERAAQLFLDYIRANVRYRSDPPLVEFVKGAAVTLCVPGAAACIPVGDCDDLCVALASLCMAYGIEARVTVQDFGPDDNLHVIITIKDSRGNWQPADPSHPSAPVGRKVFAQKEWHYDPLEPEAIGAKGAPEAEFVSVGELPAHVQMVGDAADTSTSALSTGQQVVIGGAIVLALAGGIYACSRYCAYGRRAPPSVRKFAREARRGAMAAERAARRMGSSR